MLITFSGSSTVSAKLFLPLCRSQVSLTVFQSMDVPWLSVVTDMFVGLSLSEAINLIILLFMGQMGLAILKFPYLAGVEDFF